MCVTYTACESLRLNQTSNPSVQKQSQPQSVPALTTDAKTQQGV